MKYCPSCATSLDDNIRECPQCGHIFTDTSSVSDAFQRPGNGNTSSVSSNNADQVIQPPAYSVPPASNQTQSNNQTQSQAVPKWKQLLPLFIALGVIVTIMQGCIFGMGGSSGSSKPSDTEITTTTTVKTYEISFVVDCEENLFFSKYDVIVLIDGQNIGKIDHGKKVAFTMALTEGKHSIKFHKEGSESVDGNREIEVTEKSSINCKIHCTSSQVEIKEFSFTSDETKPSSNSTTTTAPSSEQTDTTKETSITTTAEPTPTPVPTDITKEDDTRFAFKRAASDYTIYYIIDLKEKKVYYFTSLDTKATVGTFENGDLKKGITVKYPYDGGTDVISYYKGDTNKIVVFDQNGFDWYYDACYVSEAENIITN